MTPTPLPCPSSESPIGVFDSGMGGLSIVRELLRELPREQIVYYADNLRMPYGPRPLEEVRRFSLEIAENLLRLPAKVVVIACNTASAAALKEMRLIWPDRIFVGMEPAVKPAARESGTGRIGVLATEATFQGRLFESVVERFAAGVEVIRQPCPGLAEFIESHGPGDADLEPLLAGFIGPLRSAGVDRLVLACTHYPLVKEAIRRVAGPEMHIVDPSPAIAGRTRQVLDGSGLLATEGEGGLKLFAGGDTEAFSRAASVYLGRTARAEEWPG